MNVSISSVYIYKVRQYNDEVNIAGVSFSSHVFIGILYCASRVVFYWPGPLGSETEFYYKYCIQLKKVTYYHIWSIRYINILIQFYYCVKVVSLN